MSFLSSCGQQSFDEMLDELLSHTVTEVKPSELKSSKVQFLDARETEEFKISHIPGAKHIGYNNFNLELLSGIKKDTPIVVYCSVGYRSEKISEKLIESGYTNVRNLYGGIFLWKDAGFEVVDENGPTERVHTYSEKWSKWLKSGNKVW